MHTYTLTKTFSSGYKVYIFVLRGVCFRPNLKTERTIKLKIESNLIRTRRTVKIKQYLNAILHDVRDVWFRSN
jgi:hypothetical protein